MYSTPELKKTFIFPLLLVVIFFSIPAFAKAQTDSAGYIRMPASENYHKSDFYQKLWGKHYRRVWHTPVLFKKVNLDTLVGGLIPTETGGGRQSKSLRLHDKDDRQYVLRSIDKSLSDLLPDGAEGNILEDIANDQISFSIPYSALVVADLAGAAGIYHTKPEIFFVPKQPALKEFNDSMGDKLYLFEERPDEDWEIAPHLGSSKKIVSTEKLLENLLEDNSNSIDQETYLRSRLFDMFIGDWDRHEDQWRWATKEQVDDVKIYEAIPRDRDNAFTKMDGLLTKAILGAVGGSHMEDFGFELNNVNRFNFSSRHLDRRALNELPFERWNAVVTDLVAKLSDAAIDNAMKKFPPEVYPILAGEIASKLKSRREFLPLYASEYYHFISKEVEIPGTENNEKFVVSTLSPTQLEVEIFDLKKDGTVRDNPFYSRVFNTDETKEVRIYGIDGDDQFELKGDQQTPILVRLIGSKESNTYTGTTKSKVLVYDDKSAEVGISGPVKGRLSADSMVHNYDYHSFVYDKTGFQPVIFYSNEDRIFAGLSYQLVKQGFRKQPFASKQLFSMKYSFGQKAVSAGYEGTFTEAIGKWNGIVSTNFDMIRWTNFFGIGNENSVDSTDINFNRVRNRQFEFKTGIGRIINGIHKISITPLFSTYDIINDEDRYLAKYTNLNTDLVRTTQYFLGGEIQYLLQKVNDTTLPTSGLSWQTIGSYSQNLKISNNHVANLESSLTGYIPFSDKLSLSTKLGAATLWGNPLFYQYNKIGGNQRMRGFQRDRFYGNSSFYNQNDLRWITDVRSRLYSGKFGIFALLDHGRVWLKGEESNTWHYGYGGGFIISPFRKITATLAYARSKDDNNLHVGLIKAL